MAAVKGFEPLQTESEARNLFFKTAYLSHFSDFASLKNLSEFYFCSARQIRMRNCEPYTEVYKETLNPHYLLQQGNASFGDEEYKSVLPKCHIWWQISTQLKHNKPLP